MNFTDKKIYELLPSLYRLKDSELASYNENKELFGSLEDLVKIIAGQARIAEKDIGDLYKNWFIETCAEWVVPYIGDLLGVRTLNTIEGSSSVVSQRAYVANTLRYRRRKGIAPVLEQLTQDVAGWRAHVVEFFELLATTQYMNHIRLHRPATPDLRQMNQLDLINGPFENTAHTADVRHIKNNRGKYNIMNIGIFAWRLQNYPVKLSDAREIPCPSSPPFPGATMFTFDPLGNPTNLFNNPETEKSITHISTEVNVPGLLRRRALFDELEARRLSSAKGKDISYNFFSGADETTVNASAKKYPVFSIYKDDDPKPVPADEILICNLANCCTVPADKTYKVLQNDGTYLDVPKKISAAVDPVSGRFIFRVPPVKGAKVSYSYGFSGDLGAGTFDRQHSINSIFMQSSIWQAGVTKATTPAFGALLFDTVQKAVTEWNKQPAGTVGVISVMDNGSYDGDLEIEIKEKSRLLIIAAGWPATDKPEGIGKERIAGNLAAEDLRPHIRGNVFVKGILSDTESKTGGELTINGLLIEGKMAVRKGNLGVLTIQYTTLVPSKGGFEIGVGLSTNDKKSSNQWLKLNLERCICGPVAMNNSPIGMLAVEDCIIDGSKSGKIINYPSLVCDAAPVQLKGSTFYGNVSAKIIEAENCIFCNDVRAIRRQTGCIRYSYVQLTSEALTPRKYRCQPRLEIMELTEAAEKKGFVGPIQKNLIKEHTASWLVPVFTSTGFGHHAYAQLGAGCPEQIKAGADNGSEMGAFRFLMQPQRAANLRIALDEYLRLGLEAGIFYVT